MIFCALSVLPEEPFDEFASWKINRSFSFVVLSSVVIVGVLAVNQSRALIVETAWKEERVLAATLSKEIDAHLRERLALLEFLSVHRQVRGMNREEQREILSPLFERYGFLEVGVVDLQGNIPSNRQEGLVVNIADCDYFIRTLKEKKNDDIGSDNKPRYGRHEFCVRPSGYRRR